MRKEITIGIAIEVIGNGTGIGLQMTGIVSPTIGWVVIVVSNAIGFFLIGYSLVKPETVSSQPAQPMTMLAPPKKRLDRHDKAALAEVVEYMLRVHGHADEDTMEASLLRGVVPDDLLKKGICGKCGKPRNQEGGFLL